MQMITGKTKLLGLIGYPLEHSLSPVMQNAALAHLGLDYGYVAFLIQPKKKKLKDAIAGLTAIDNLVGFNVTIPHKQAIIPFRILHKRWVQSIPLCVPTKAIGVAPIPMWKDFLLP
jgi:shikimate 5-dehydrogenase